MVKRGERPHKKAAITKLALEALVVTCDGSFEDLRDRALLHFAFANSGRRGAKWLSRTPARDLHPAKGGGYIFRLEHSKAHQSGFTADSHPNKRVFGVTADALRAWLTTAKLSEAAIVRQIWKTRVRPAPGPPPQSPRSSSGARRAQSGLGRRSLRSGFVPESGRQGIAVLALMAMPEHRSGAP